MYVCIGACVCQCVCMSKYLYHYSVLEYGTIIMYYFVNTIFNV